MTAEVVTHAERIASSAALAAWVGASASTVASVVALTVAVWSARREEGRRLRTSADRETAFAFGMVGALEMAKPLIAEAQARPEGETPRRRFTNTVAHARVIAEAALGIQVFDMQMLRDAYLIRDALNGLHTLLEDLPPDAAGVPHRVLLEAVDPVLGGLLDADDRFFGRLPRLSEVQGVHDRTVLARPREP